MADTTAAGEHAPLTEEERRTYQSLRSLGVSHDDALSDALDGVHVDDVRRPGSGAAEAGDQS